MAITSGRTEITKQITTDNKKTQQRTLKSLCCVFYFIPSYYNHPNFSNIGFQRESGFSKGLLSL